MATWQTQEAKARFSELLDAAEKKGPQVITRRGVETAVLVPIREWKLSKPQDTRTLLEVLQSGPQFEIPIPPRGRMRRRKTIVF